MSNHGLLKPSPEEAARRDRVMRQILRDIRESRTIKLPDFDVTLSRPSDQFALTNIGAEPNDYSGVIGDYRYQFEGEEDLLHLIITRTDATPLVVETAQQVVSCVLNGVPPALIWLRPGTFSQHFYFGHDDLIGNLVLSDAETEATPS